MEGNQLSGKEELWSFGAGLGLQKKIQPRAGNTKAAEGARP